MTSLPGDIEMELEDRCARPSEMVERVARAMGTARIAGVAWDEYAPEVCDDLFAMAHIAIEAMREPTEAMMLAASRTEYTASDGHGCWTEWVDREVAEAAWPAMIDAALSPAQRSSNHPEGGK